MQAAWQGWAEASGHAVFKSAGHACPVFYRVRQQVAPQRRGLAGRWVGRQEQPSKLWLHHHGKQRTINSRACCSSSTHGLVAGEAPNPWGQSVAASLDEEGANSHRESRSTFLPKRRTLHTQRLYHAEEGKFQGTAVMLCPNEHTWTSLQRASKPKSPLQCGKGADLCRTHGFLRMVLGAVGVLQLAEFLDENVWVSAAISILFVVAAASGWMLGETQCLQAHDAVSNGVDARFGWVAIAARQPNTLAPAHQQILCWQRVNHSLENNPAGGQAALAARVRSLCVAAIFVLAGVSEVVELLFSLSAGRVDTHVLMTLACFGTLAIGSGLEVRCLLRMHSCSLWARLQTSPRLSN